MDHVWWTFLKMFIALPIVLILVLLTMRYNLKSFRQKCGQNRMIRVVDRLVIDKNSTVQIIEVQGVFYLIGSQPGHMILIDTLDNFHDLARTQERKIDSFESILGEKIKLFSQKVTQQFYSGKNNHDNKE